MERNEKSLNLFFAKYFNQFMVYAREARSAPQSTAHKKGE